MLLGILAQALDSTGWIKNYIKGEHQIAGRTVQRYLKGHTIKDLQHVQLFREAFVSCLYEEQSAIFGLSLEEARTLLERACTTWDLLVGSSETHGFVLPSATHHVLVMGRVFGVQLGVIWGTLRAREHLKIGLQATTSNTTSGTFDHQDFMFGGWLESLFYDQSWEKTAAKLGEDVRTIRYWRKAEKLPKSESIERLAYCACDAEYSNSWPYRDPKKLFIELRWVRGLSELLDKLKGVLQDFWLDQLLRSIEAVAQHTYALHMSEFEPSREVLLELSRWLTWEYSPSTGALQLLAQSIQSYGFTHEAIQDVMSLASMNTLGARVNHWASQASYANVKSISPHTHLLDVEDYFRFFHRMWHSIPPEGENARCYRTRLPAPLRNMIRTAHAEQQIQRGEWSTAIPELESILDETPQLSHAHFHLGSAVGYKLLYEGYNEHWYKKGLGALKQAIRLSPKDGVFRNELAIFQTRVQFFDLALDASDEAEPYARRSEHYWFTRGHIYLCLSRWSDAIGAYECAEKVASSGRYLQAKRWRAIALCAAGREYEGRRCARQPGQAGWAELENLDKASALTMIERLKNPTSHPC